jgi:hypothetical protein
MKKIRPCHNPMCDNVLKSRQKLYCSSRCWMDRYSQITTQAKEIKKKYHEPCFVENNLKWAIEVYNFYYNRKVRPRHTSDEYGLYKYGEFICRNEGKEL